MKVLLWSVLSVTLAGTVVLGGTVIYLMQDLPPLTGLHEYQPSLVTRVYSADKQVIGQFFVERRILVPLDKIPRHLVNAVIAIEDARFFEHRGLDFVGIARAAMTNMLSGARSRSSSSTSTRSTSGTAPMGFRPPRRPTSEKTWAR